MMVDASRRPPDHTGAVANDYSPRWFSAFLETVPDNWTENEVAGVMARLPLPEFGELLDVCCGSGRHARRLVAAGYRVTGIDRDRDAIARARRAAPDGRFLAVDQRDLLLLHQTFDAAVILWQSFGYFDSSTNDHILADIATCLRSGGRLLLDVYHPGFVRATAGPTTSVRTADCRSITNAVVGDRLRSTIEYVDGATEEMDFELLEPDDLAQRAEHVGFRAVEACCWWDGDRPPTPTEPRYQLVLERT
jgi:SAM-dependent methyltransferase